MMMPASVAARRAALALRCARPMPVRMFSQSVRALEGSAASPKIAGIVDSIEKLTLLEAAELVQELKTRLNITDIAMPAAAPAAPAAAAPAEEAPAEEKPKEKTLFTLKFAGLANDSAKAKVIKEVKAINSNMNLVEAKKFVESAPQTLKENVTKEDAEKIKEAVEKAGGKIELV
ncbi:54S ribosomal protein L12, mitochondrial [Malassezia caprae]|uniref:54S ribosomal protein L12, mitochondrial n=1 Tax=Malassezia caprae TaxID=1381934 RepID=A0AAF0EE38_9BASI|nr:54S ribosomal protein L12, mitochondrial [Malassezia caprae]